MKLVDLNVLIYGTDTESPRFDVAGRWLDTALGGTETIAIPTAVSIGFVRLVTNPRVLVSPLGAEEAASIVKRWLARSNVVVPQPTHRHFDVLAELVVATGTGGNIVSDAHLAALAIEHGAELVSFDNDFGRFPGLTWLRPDELG